jgi:uncharacterized protein (TIGR00730 family)
MSTPPRTFRRLAVYCGSSTTVDPQFLLAANAVGRRLAELGIGVVYGGGKAGLMGEVADGALAAGGEVIGVITDKLVGLEVGHGSLTERYVVPTMHARKSMMAELSDGFIALPGGLGTFEELFEAATWTQLNDHIKPVGLLNIGGYYDLMLAFLAHAEKERFIRPSHTCIIQADAVLDSLIFKMSQVDLPILGTWKP